MHLIEITDLVVVNNTDSDSTTVIRTEGGGTEYFRISANYRRKATQPIINEPIDLTMRVGQSKTEIPLRLELNPGQQDASKLLWTGRLNDVSGNHVQIAIQHNGAVVKEEILTLV